MFGFILNWFKKKELELSFKDQFNENVRFLKANRKAQGLEPTSESWELITGIDQYLLLFPMSENTAKIVLAAHKVFTAAEAEMDYDRASVAVSTMAYFISPPRQFEHEPEYTDRILREFLRYREQHELPY